MAKFEIHDPTYKPGVSVTIIHAKNNKEARSIYRQLSYPYRKSLPSGIWTRGPLKS